MDCFASLAMTTADGVGQSALRLQTRENHAKSRIFTDGESLSLGTIFASRVAAYSPGYPEPPMGEVVRLIPKSELERARLIREARAIYEHIFPPADQASKRPDPEK
jgi:hypothetical protein